MRLHRTSASGLLLALLALAMQLAFGSVVPRLEIASALAGATTICHADETSGEAPPTPHNPADCPICPLCVSLSGPALALTTHPPLPTPHMVVVAPVVVLPPATAPPATVVLAARPRGPPIILT
jgi:hypothetical protein